MASVSSDQLLSFRVGDESLAISAGAVREVIRPPAIVRVPHAPKALVGLGNLRGTVLSIVSMARLIDRPAGAGQRVIVLDDAHGVGILVDEVDTLIDPGQTQGADRTARLIDIAKLLAGDFGGAKARQPGSSRLASISSETAAATTASDDLVLLTFAIGDQEFALPLDEIEEIIRLPETIAIMPQVDDAVVGTAAHRGDLLPLLSLRHLLSLPEGMRATAPRVVIARLARNRVGLVVDAVHAIVRVAPDLVDIVPVVLTRGSGEARIQAICRLDGGRRLISLLAAHQLLREDLAARLADDQGEQQALDDKVVAETSEQFLMFRIGDQDFGLPVAAVSEVVRMPDKLGTLPRAPKFVEGIMNLRGQAIPLIDQRRRFDAPAEEGARRRVVIVASGDMQVGFVVDGVSDVVRVAIDDLHAAPDLGDGAVRVFDRVAHIGKEQRMVLLVEPRELLDRAEKDLLAAMVLEEETSSR